MTETLSKPRQTADIAFGKAQSQFIARERAFEEIHSIVAERDEKTLRLREARLAKERLDQATPPAKSPSKRTRKA